MCQRMRCTPLELGEQPAEVIDIIREFIIGEDEAVAAAKKQAG
jgi:hypothetical protein